MATFFSPDIRRVGSLSDNGFNINPDFTAKRSHHPPDIPSVYQGAPLSLEEMEKAIDIEAGKQK